MSIQSEITRLDNAISAAYDAIETKGGTLPVSTNISNLASAISSIPVTVQQITTGSGDYEDYYKNLTAHQNFYYLSSSSSSLSLSVFGENDLTDGFAQIDSMIWASNSGSFFFYYKIGQDDTEEYLPINYYYTTSSSGNNWFQTSKSLTMPLYLKKSELEAGTEIRVYNKYGDTYTANSPSWSGGYKILVQWHEID